MKKMSLFDNKVEVLVSEVSDGNMRFFGDDEDEIIENQRSFSGTDGSKIARIRTIYGERKKFTEFFEITNENLSEYNILNFEKRIPVSDGLVTRCADVGILLPLADCLGVVVFDEEKQALGLLHAGRHNVEQDGPRKFTEYFYRKFNSRPENLKVYFSPCAQNYCLFLFDNKKLSEVALEQIMEAGVLEENIVVDERDTVSDDELFSHSAGDIDKRFAIVARMN